MLEKTKELHNQILGYIREGKTSVASLVQATGKDRVTIYNNIKALEKSRAIARQGKIQTGKRGRQPVVFTVNM